jgi:hypothetical protein
MLIDEIEQRLYELLIRGEADSPEAERLRKLRAEIRPKTNHQAINSKDYDPGKTF